MQPSFEHGDSVLSSDFHVQGVSIGLSVQQTLEIFVT